MGELKLDPPGNVLSPRVIRVLEAESVCKTKADRNGHPSGAAPFTPPPAARVEHVKAGRNGSLPSAEEPTAARIAQRFAPRAQAVSASRDHGSAADAPLTPSLIALASGFRALAAALIVVAVLPNLTLGALLWFRLLDIPWFQSAALPPGESPAPAAPSVLSLPPAAAEDPIVADSATVLVVTAPPDAVIGANGAKTEPEETRARDDLETYVFEATAAPAEEPWAKLSAATLTPEMPVLIAAPPEMPALIAAPDVAAATVTPDVPLPTRRPPPTDRIMPLAHVNLRNGPSPSAPVISVVAKGIELPVMGRRGRWVKVTNPADSAVGWVYSGNIAAVR